jgi:hypothetical protein
VRGKEVPCKIGNVLILMDRPKCSNPTLSATSFDASFQALGTVPRCAQCPIECQIQALRAHSNG